MARRKRSLGGATLERFSEAVTRKTGSTPAFGAAAGVIVVWAALGPVFGFSDTWQLVINTGTTIVTFLMVFLIQRTQNKDALAIHIKLNELVAAVKGASNRVRRAGAARARGGRSDQVAFRRGRIDPPRC